MSDREKGTTHRRETTGTSDGSDWTEHREKARGSEQHPNELRPEERADEPGERDGPRTHQDTRITSADGE